MVCGTSHSLLNFPAWSSGSLLYWCHSIHLITGDSIVPQYTTATPAVQLAMFFVETTAPANPALSVEITGLYIPFKLLWYFPQQCLPRLCLAIQEHFRDLNLSSWKILYYIILYWSGMLKRQAVNLTFWFPKDSVHTVASIVNLVVFWPGSWIYLGGVSLSSWHLV